MMAEHLQTFQLPAAGGLAECTHASLELRLHISALQMVQTS